MTVEKVSILIMNQAKFRSVRKQEETCYYDHILFCMHETALGFFAMGQFAVKKKTLPNIT